MPLNIKVGPIGLLDMLKFKNQPKVRRAAIARAPSTPLPKAFGSNLKAEALHPERQSLRIAQVIDRGPNAKTFVFESADGKPLAFFRAGQYLSLSLSIGGSRITRPYSICSSPKQASEGRYEITVKEVPDGFASGYMLANWKVGAVVEASGPQGAFHYEGLRDARRIVGVAGGSGITPFLSMARALRDGTEDFELTILYGSRSAADILFRDELDSIAASCPKVKIVHVLSDAGEEGFERGYITADLIGKHAGSGRYGVFMCGPRAMYSFLDGELPKLRLPRKDVRRELFGAPKDPRGLPGYPAGASEATFKLAAIIRGERFEMPCLSTETMLAALERSGVAVPSRCRSGECGFCRSKLVSGPVFIPEDIDGRRAGDLAYGYVHPCATYALGDLVIEAPGAS